MPSTQPWHTSCFSAIATALQAHAFPPFRVSLSLSRELRPIVHCENGETHSTVPNGRISALVSLEAEAAFEVPVATV